MTHDDANQDLARKLRIRLENASEYTHDALKTARRATGDSRRMWTQAALRSRAEAKQIRAALARLGRAEMEHERSDQK